MSQPGDTAKLGEIAEFVRGITFKPDDVVPADTVGSVRCMRTKNVQVEIDLSDAWSVDSKFVKRANQHLQTGDLLVSSANSWNLVGKCCWVPEEVSGSTFGGFISVLRPNREKVDSRYLYRWFSSGRIQATVRGFGRQTTNISNLDLTRCLSLPIPLPPLDRQRRIAQALDSVDTSRARRRKTIALLDDLTRSVFLAMFGDPVINEFSWQSVPLTEACYCYSGGTPSKADELNWIGGVPWFSAKDMKQGELFKSRDTISKSVTEKTSLRLLPKNTVTIVVRGMILAHSFPVCILRVPATINQDLKALLPRVKLHPEFLATCLRVQSHHALAQVSAAAHGTTRLDAEGLTKIKILLPPEHLQDQFVERVSCIEALRTQQTAHLAELDALFASLQHRAFSSELWDALAV